MRIGSACDAADSRISPGFSFPHFDKAPVPDGVVRGEIRRTTAVQDALVEIDVFPMDSQGVTSVLNAKPVLLFRKKKEEVSHE